jgi:hypothetical protein
MLSQAGGRLEIDPPLAAAARRLRPTYGGLLV